MPKRRRGGSPPPFRMNAQELLEWIGPVLRRVAAYLPPQMIVPMVPGYGPTPVRRPAPPAAPLPSEVKRLKRRAPFLCRSAKRLTLDELNAQALSATSPPARHPRVHTLIDDSRALLPPHCCQPCPQRPAGSSREGLDQAPPASTASQAGPSRRSGRRDRHDPYFRSRRTRGGGA
ncbi:hypothetical protein PTTG_25988 [Puccinia triticina 1-1 BBBD Race 1]|uniref:Uncharacterized protein n=2 Tax=Puccinia triticina TaxID=208348 RepID=A0A180GYV6_PUCT1|nr:uncharacterized protein PtA15_12A122 [Puccinia triticina]OAV97539.1 hypothetical protein PTTG_25988 [Puccinia triticina 1-1 BBBD Race 1]WAQ90136.1 hypothetical protein PtA15_12A122 [Puccinia triticina]